MDLEPMTSLSIYHLYGEEVPIELELIGQPVLLYNSCIYQASFVLPI